jgi:hypothetical protein
MRLPSPHKPDLKKYSKKSLQDLPGDAVMELDESRGIN